MGQSKYIIHHTHCSNTADMQAIALENKINVSRVVSQNKPYLTSIFFLSQCYYCMFMSKFTITCCVSYYTINYHVVACVHIYFFGPDAGLGLVSQVSCSSLKPACKASQMTLYYCFPSSFFNNLYVHT